MPRPATGSPRWNPSENRWEARITIPGQGRPPVPMREVPACLSGTPLAHGAEDECSSCKMARRIAKRLSDKMRSEGRVRGDTGTTVSEWFKDYYDAAGKGHVGRKNKGKPQAAVDDRRSAFENWIEPVIGTYAMTAVTAAHLRRVVSMLDDAIRERAAFYERDEDERTGRKPGLSPKTAQNVWSEITNGFREARRSKDNALAISAASRTRSMTLSRPRPATTASKRPCSRRRS